VVVIAQPRAVPAPIAPPADEAVARRALRAQIARLAGELDRTVAAAFPHVDVPASATARTARILDLGALEQVRDDLAERVRRAHQAVDERGRFEAANRAALEEMLRDPARHRGVSIPAADVGEHGCGAYTVRPRLGIVGRCMGWWHVKLSSGCPLPARS
jgi:hypothetical protein